jgi:hypothetical protein
MDRLLSLRLIERPMKVEPALGLHDIGEIAAQPGAGTHDITAI